MADGIQKMAARVHEAAASDRIRVLHFVSTLSHGSGVMSVIMNYYRHMDREKVQFDFLYFLPSEDTYVEEIKGLGGRVHQVEKPDGSIDSLKQLDLFFQTCAKEYAWLHNHEVYLTFLLRPISKKYGLERFIVHCHATRYSDKLLNALRNRLLCQPIRFLKVERFACSEAAGKFLYGKKKLTAGKVFIMHNAIDCEKFRFQPDVRERLRKEMGLEGKFVIGHVGRFERQKNHKFLIEVFNQVHKELQESTLLLVGDGSLMAITVNQTKRKGLSNSVIFLGQRDDVAELLNVMDLFILPSLFEGLGIVLLEAQLNGLKCIASNQIPVEASTGNMFFLARCNRISLWEHAVFEIRNSNPNTNQLRLLDSERCIKEFCDSGKNIDKAVKSLEIKYVGKMV